MMRRWIPLCLLLIVLSACQVSTPIAPTAPAPTPTPTLVPLASPEQLTAWKFYDPRDPTRQDLIIKDGDSYRLDPTWQVKSIEYVSAFQGFPLEFKQMLITREGGEVERDKGLLAASPDQMQAFIDSIADLYPIQATLQDPLYATDSSGSTRVELVGDDGRRLQLLEVYNGGTPPWNVIDNGRLYAQYDEQLTLPLYQIIDPDRAARMAKAEKQDLVEFFARGKPVQISYGFSGLLPIAPLFGYAVRASTGEIEGSIWHHGLWGRAEGDLTGLERVTLEQKSGSNVPCSILVAQSEHEELRFRCKLTTPQLDGLFHYPITIELNTSAGQLFTTTGILQGDWRRGQSDQIYLPLPLDLQSALEANPSARDLLTDHVATARYRGLVTITNPLAAQLEGDISLLGQLSRNGTFVRYKFDTPFEMQDGRLTTWNLTRSILAQLVYETGQQAITRQVMQANSEALWLLSYSEAESQSDSASLKIPDCGSIAVRDLPTTTVPLRTFSFDAIGVELALIDGQTVVASASFWPDETELNRQLRPTVLAQADQLPYESIEWSDNRLEIWLPYEITEEDRKSWEELAATLPGRVLSKEESIFESILTIEDIGLILTQDNKLEFTACH